MRVIVIVIACCLMMARFAMGENLLAKPLSNQHFMGKRYIEGKAALAAYLREQKEQAANSVEERELTKAFFVKNYVQLFSKSYGKNNEGEIIRSREIDESGKMVNLIKKGEKVVAVNAQDVWETFESGEQLIVRETASVNCGFCDGVRYVIYFPEELAEFKAHYQKNHKNHDPTRRDISYSKSRTEAKEKADLASRSSLYGWDEVVSALRDDYTALNRECCWTEVHEQGSRKFRHTCPVCKGKKVTKQVRLVKYTVYEK